MILLLYINFPPLSSLDIYSLLIDFIFSISIYFYSFVSLLIHYMLYFSHLSLGILDELWLNLEYLDVFVKCFVLCLHFISCL